MTAVALTVALILSNSTNEPHVLAGLLNALTYVDDDDDARRIANQALAHRSFIVRRGEVG